MATQTGPLKFHHLLCIILAFTISIPSNSQLIGQGGKKKLLPLKVEQTKQMQSHEQVDSAGIYRCEECEMKAGPSDRPTACWTYVVKTYPSLEKFKLGSAEIAISGYQTNNELSAEYNIEGNGQIHFFLSPRTSGKEQFPIVNLFMIKQTGKHLRLIFSGITSNTNSNQIPCTKEPLAPTSKPSNK